MGLETGVTYIEDLVPTNPVGATDFVDEGDDHLRNIKVALQGSFPNLGAEAVTKTAAEINDLLTTANADGIRLNIKQDPFNATGDGVTDDTVAIQSAINFASQTGISLYAPAGTYIYSRLYCYYDAILNSGYSITNYRGTTIYGDGPMHRQDWKADAYLGTVFESSTTTGTCFNHSSSTSQTNGGVIYGMSFTGATTGNLVSIGGSFGGIKLSNFFIGNDNVAAGTALYASDIWIGEISDGDIVGNKAFVNGTPVYAANSFGIRFQTDLYGGGNILWKNVTSAFFETAMSFGKAYNVSNNICKNHKMLNCQSQYSDNGMLVRHGMLDMTIENHWFEGCAVLDMKIYDSAENIKTIGGLFGSSGLTVANVELGDNTGTAATDAVYGVTMDDPYLSFCDIAGIRKHPGALDVLLYRPVFKNNGGAAIQIDSTEQAELEVWNPNWFPEIAGTIIPEARQVTIVTGGPTYTDARYLIRDGNIGTSQITADLDMSAWRKPIRNISANTTSADIRISLPTGATVYGGDIEITKGFAANSTIIDAGTGKVVRPASGGVGAQTYTIDGISRTVRVKHQNDGDNNWFLTGSSVDSDGTTGASGVTSATGTVDVVIDGTTYSLTYE